VQIISQKSVVNADGSFNYRWAVFFLVSWGGVRLSPLGTSVTNWPIVSASDDRWRMWSSRRNENWKGKPKYSEKTCPSATLSKNSTWSTGGKPVTNSYGTAL
jgi:hypothetical protein